MPAAEFTFVQPPHRSIQLIPDRSEGHYLLTMFERAAPLPTLQKLPFRRTQWAAIRNGHLQVIYLAEGRLEIKPDGDKVGLSLSVSKLPPFTAVPDVGVLLMSDFESAMEIADRMLISQTPAATSSV